MIKLMIRALKETLFRTSEALVAIGAVLLFFLIFMAILALSFPEGTALSSLVLSGTDDGLKAGASHIDLEVPEQETFIAVLSQAQHSVKNKRADAIAWADASVGMALEERHSVQTLARSGAVVSFGGEHRLVLEENSLIVIRSMTRSSRHKRRRTSVVALEGKLRGRVESGTSGDDDLEIEVVTASGTTRVRGDENVAGDFDVSVNPDGTSTFSVHSGSAEVTSEGRTVTLRANQTITVAPAEPPGRPVALPDPPALATPRDGSAVAFRSASPPIRFEWSGQAEAYRLEVGRDADLSEIVYAEEVQGLEFVHGNLPAGRYYWRVTSLAGWAEGSATEPRILDLFRDTDGPGLEVIFPEGRVSVSRAVLRGVTEPGARVFVSDHDVALENAGTFERVLNLDPGLNLVVVEAIDAAGNVTYRSKLINAEHERSSR